MTHPESLYIGKALVAFSKIQGSTNFKASRKQSSMTCVMGSLPCGKAHGDWMRSMASNTGFKSMPLVSRMAARIALMSTVGL